MRIYPNPMMPQRGGWWPECLGTAAIIVGSGAAGMLLAFLFHGGLT